MAEKNSSPVIPGTRTTQSMQREELRQFAEAYSKFQEASRDNQRDRILSVFGRPVRP